MRNLGAPRLASALLQAAVVLAAVSAVWPQTPSVTAPKAESAAKREARLRWWRDARFGMFIHWSPNSLTGKELSWSRGGTKPLDVTGDPAGYVEDPVYDHLYERFNPTRFDAAQWVRIAKAAGMKYMVLTAKHHEGFSMFHTRYSNYSIDHTPFERDIVGELADACHKAGMRFGIYYSPRDWHHPDYGVGDNSKYHEFLKGQLTELLTHYGKVDVVWFDSFGRGDSLSFWKAGEVLDLTRKLAPKAVINNRCTSYANTDPSLAADFDTPEQTIGRMQTDRAWESCMCLVGGQWSYLPGGEMKSSQEVIRDLVSCATGDGNILLDVGPMPTGEIEPRQAARLAEVGDWLKRHGRSIYGTRGGPFRNGDWGGSTYRGDRVYLHLFQWTGTTLRLNPIPEAVRSVRYLAGGQVPFTQGKDGLSIEIGKRDPSQVDTVLELRLDRPVSRIYEGPALR